MTNMIIRGLRRLAHHCTMTAIEAHEHGDMRAAWRWSDRAFWLEGKADSLREWSNR